MQSKPDYAIIDKLLPQVDALQNFFVPVSVKNYFEKEAIADVYQLYGNIMQLHCSDWGYGKATTEDFLEEWVYIATGQAKTEGLQDCKFLEQIDELREMYARSAQLPPDISWNEIIGKELDRYSGPIEIALRDGLDWAYIHAAVQENRRASKIRLYELPRDSNIDDILAASRASKAEATTGLLLALEEKRTRLERVRRIFELSNDMPLDEVERWFDRKLLQLRIEKAQDSGVPPDDLEI